MTKLLSLATIATLALTACTDTETHQSVKTDVTNDILCVKEPNASYDITYEIIE
jgi:hypothetical protein